MKEKYKSFYRNRLTVIVLILIAIPAIALGQCPIISNPTQSFCNIDDPTVADLIATDNGNGIQWYATTSSVTPLSSSEGLVNGEDYFVDDNSGTCGVREQVDVTIYSAPFGLNFQGVCVDDPMDATISDLTAFGNNVQWYNAASGGTPLLPSTILNDNTIYYADQENPDTGCRTSRLSVLVVIGVVPVPTGESIQMFCSENPPTVADLVASGANNWYATIGSVIPLDPSTPLIDGENYFATSSDPPCESIVRFEVTVVIEEPANSGTSATLDICESEINTIGSVDLIDELGSPDTSGTWTGPLATTNGSTGTVDITTMTVAGSPYVFTYTVDPGNSCAISNSTVTIIISPEANAGIGGTIDICNNDTTQDLFDVLTGNPDINGNWSPPLNSGTGLFDPNIDSPGIYTYNVNGIGACTDASTTVIATIIPKPNAGDDGNVVICSDEGSQNLFDFIDGNPDTGGTWFPALDSGTGIFDPNIDAPGVYIYSLELTQCNQRDSSELIVSIENNPNATGLEILVGNICLGLANSVTITGATLLPDGNYTIIYSLSGSNNSENSIDVVFVSGNTNFSIPENLLTDIGTTTITIVSMIPVNSVCGVDTSNISPVNFIVFDNTIPEIIKNGNIFCKQDNPTIENLTANIVGNTPITWYDAPNGGTAYSVSTLLINGETYYASTLTADGCESIPRLEVLVELMDCPKDIIIPDGFSPNNDYVNDDFNIVNLRELYPNFTLEIYNRYGNILYKGNINTPNWNGYSDKGLNLGNSKLPVGVYFFILKFNDGTRKPIQGRVYLSR